MSDNNLKRRNLDLSEFILALVIFISQRVHILYLKEKCDYEVLAEGFIMSLVIAHVRQSTSYLN